MKEKLSIMLIDDNEFDLFVFEKLIQKKELSSALFKYQDAAKALEFLDKNKDDQWPELIILDIHMPVIDGFEFLDKYAHFPQKKRTDTNIILISSTLDSSDNQRALENEEVLALLEKPLNIDELILLLSSSGILKRH